MRSPLSVSAIVATGIHLAFIVWAPAPAPEERPSVVRPRPIEISIVKPREKNRTAPLKKASPPAKQPPAVAAAPAVSHAVSPSPAAVEPDFNPRRITPDSTLLKKKRTVSAVKAVPDGPARKPVPPEPPPPATEQPRGPARKMKTDRGRTVPAAFKADAPGRRSGGTGGETAPAVIQPRYGKNPPPVYPPLARKRGRQGTVTLLVLVSEDGRAETIAIDLTSGFPILDRAAVAAVQKWVFKPGMENGRFISAWVRIPVTFKLE